MGDKDGTCACLIVSVFGGFDCCICCCCGGGDGVIERDSVSRVYLSEIEMGNSVSRFETKTKTKKITSVNR